ncbi:MAG: TetR/AcrR family transcriptional regulator [Spirochaetaceae bacterium]
MPPKVQFTKEQILDAALELVISDGVDSLSARNLAKKLNSSVAPIYANYKNTKELFDDVLEKIKIMTWEYSTKPYTPHGFFNIGIGQLLIANDFPNLFMDLLYKSSIATEMDCDTENMMIDIMVKDEKLKGLSRSQCGRVLEKMAIFTSGLAIAVANESQKLPINRALEIMEESANQIIYAERDGNYDRNLEKIDFDNII